MPSSWGISLGDAHMWEVLAAALQSCALWIVDTWKVNMIALDAQLPSRQPLKEGKNSICFIKLYFMSCTIEGSDAGCWDYCQNFLQILVIASSSMRIHRRNFLFILVTGVVWRNGIMNWVHWSNFSLLGCLESLEPILWSILNKFISYNIFFYLPNSLLHFMSLSLIYFWVTWLYFMCIYVFAILYLTSFWNKFRKN